MCLLPCHDTHIHTHSFCLSLSLFPVSSLSPPLLSRTHAHTHIHTHVHIRARTQKHTHTLSSCTGSQQIFSVYCPSMTHAHTHTHTHCISLSLTHTHTYTCTLSLSLSTHTHTHTLSQIHTIITQIVTARPHVSTAPP